METTRYLPKQYDYKKGVFQAYIPNSYVNNQPKGTGYWGVVNLEKMPKGYNYGTEYTQTHTINGRLVGAPSFNPFNSDPRYLSAFQNEMLYNQGQLKELSNDDKRFLNEAHRNTYLWARHRDKYGMSPNFIPGIDKLDTSRPQIYGNNDDDSYTTYNSGHAKLYRNGKLIPEEEALSMYQKDIDAMNNLYSQGRDGEAKNKRDYLEKSILYGSPAANKTKIWERAENENKERYKDYKPISIEEADKEFGNEYEDSTKETDELLDRERKVEEYNRVMSEDTPSVKIQEPK